MFWLNSLFGESAEQLKINVATLVVELRHMHVGSTVITGSLLVPPE